MSTQISTAPSPNAADAPVFDGDFFADDVLSNTNPTFKVLRDLGDAVWMPSLNLYAVPRYDDVLASLQAADILISGQGVSVNDQLNGPDQPANLSILTTDGLPHHKFKRIEMRMLGSDSIRALRSRLESRAQEIVDQLVGQPEFDGMKLACYLPTTVVADLVGIKNIGAEQMLRWSNAIFDAFGPPDRSRSSDAMSVIEDYVTFAMGLTRQDVTPGSWADSMLAAGEAGELSQDTARNLVFDMIIPSLDTTIYSTMEMLYQLGATPGAFETVRARPELIPGVVNEAVRMASPLRGFTRYVTEDFRLSETTLPAGSRAFVLFGSANRDERHFPEPDKFDVERNPRDHLGWGHGVHSCGGIHLARAEMEVVLETLVERVGAISVGEPTRLLNNSAQGFGALPLQLHPVR